MSIYLPLWTVVFERWWRREMCANRGRLGRENDLFTGIRSDAA